MSEKTLLIFCGGISEEHEISLISAKCVLDALDRSLFKPIVVGISKKGVWHFEEEKSFYRGDFRADKITLNEDAPKASFFPFRNAQGRSSLQVEGREVPFDLVFPLLHGRHGEDGRLQGLMDICQVPYVGSGCGSSWICMDKVLSKVLCQREGISVAEFEWVSSVQEIESKRKAIERLGFPVFVKPSRQGSSVGVGKAGDWKELVDKAKTAFKFDSKVLIERGIKGRELEVAVLGLGDSARAAVPGEIIPSPKVGWYTYEAKYILSDGADTVVPAKLTPAEVKGVQELALKAFRLLECDGMARVDMFLEQDSGKIYINEVNTIPGFTPISMYPKMWEASGVSYSKLITELVQLAERRAQQRF